MSMLVAQNIELFTLALSGITIILIPDKGPKYRTVRLNKGHLATLNMKYINRPPPYLMTWIRHCQLDCLRTSFPQALFICQPPCSISKYATEYTKKVLFGDGNRFHAICCR